MASSSFDPHNADSKVYSPIGRLLSSPQTPREHLVLEDVDLESNGPSESSDNDDKSNDNSSKLIQEGTFVKNDGIVGWKAAFLIVFSSLYSMSKKIAHFLKVVWSNRRFFAILSGPFFGFIVYYNGENNYERPKVTRMASILVWMALWWITEAIPVAITALIPLAFFPMTGILYADEVAKAYWNDIVVLYFGSLLVSLAIEKWNIHRRITLKLFLSLGSKIIEPKLLLLAFILCTGIMSMFMSNTATSIMMVPMAVAVLHKVRIQKDSKEIQMSQIQVNAKKVNKSQTNLSSEIEDSFPDHTTNEPKHSRTYPEPKHSRTYPEPTARHNPLTETPITHRHQTSHLGSEPAHSDDKPAEKDKTESPETPTAESTPNLHVSESGKKTKKYFGLHEYLEEKLEETVSSPLSVSSPMAKFFEADHNEKVFLNRNDSNVEQRSPIYRKKLSDMDDPVTQYCRAIILGIAYAASIGGMGSLTATGPNLILAGILRHMFPESPPISYFQWLGFGFPLSFIFLFVSWCVIAYIYCPEENFAEIKKALDRSVLEREYAKLGPVKFAEKAVMANFLILSILWITRNPGWGSLFENKNAVGDGTASALMAISLFIIPSFSGKPWEMLMDWDTCRTMPWDIVLLLGGGFALSAGVTSSGLASWIGDHVSSLKSLPPILIPPIISVAVIISTEFASNSATATVLLPILAGLSMSSNRHPLLLMLPATLSCSLAFMLPIATASNAVAYSTGFLKLKHLLLPGLFLNVVGMVLISLSVPTLGALIFGVLNDPTQYQWFVDAKNGVFSNPTNLYNTTVPAVEPDYGPIVAPSPFGYD